jgi:hypothetical protein
MHPLLTKMGTLKGVDAPCLATWCCLEAEFEQSPNGTRAARIAQKRVYEEKLGMSASARAKMAIDPDQKPDPAEKYFENDRVQ